MVAIQVNLTGHLTAAVVGSFGVIVVHRQLCACRGANGLFVGAMLVDTGVHCHGLMCIGQVHWCDWGGVWANEVWVL